MIENAFEKYILEINEAYLRGDSTEQTHRPALKEFVQNLGKNITATNEPKRIACGAPDFNISRKQKREEQTVGYIECKDINKDLGKESKTEQIKNRYLPSLNNLIFTNYIEFWWYVDGEKRLTAKLAEEQNGKFRITEKGQKDLAVLFDCFFAHEPEGINTAKHLALKMAGIARLLREIIHKTFDSEQETGTLHSQFEAFREVLLHDLTEEQFADMYAQTICYGLFSASCYIEEKTLYGKDKHAVFHGIDDKRKSFSRANAWQLLPKTNPFLRKTFIHIAGPDLDDRITWLVDDLVEILRHCDMGMVLRDFARKTGRKDPVVHFYETFLAEYDKKLKKSRGVYYTPDEVVSYIVRSVDILLKEKFGLKRGLADESKIKGTDQHKLLILDPAVGTGTFLFEVINQIKDKFKSQKGTWSSYVKEHLLPRIFGFELMMAPYTICHMKLGLELAETGYEFDSDDRLGVYLTNTLEEAEEKAKTLFAQWIAEEAREANDIKRVLPIMVVTGNPPYAGHSANKSWMKDENGKIVPNFIGRLIKDYYEVDGKPLGEKNPKWLQDDYVKFIRFGQHRIEKTGSGILALITNHSYLDNPTFRGMRQSLMKTFDEIYILDLHGNQKKKETCPDGSKDVNVFDIQQGVSIALFVKTTNQTNPTAVYHSDLYGIRNDKYDWLIRNDIRKTNWEELRPQKPFYLFRPQNIKSLNDYNKYWKINNIMTLNVLGFQTHRDNFAIAFEKVVIQQRINELRNPKIDNQELINKYNLKDNRDWKLEISRQNAQAKQNWEDNNIQCLYRSFDKRFCYFDEIAMDYPRRELKEHVAGKENICLGLGRQGIAVNDPEWSLISVSREPIDANIFRRGGINVFPLYLYIDNYNSKGKQNVFFDSNSWEKSKMDRVPNLNKEFVDEYVPKLKLDFVSDGTGDLTKTFGPEDLFHYIYAVLHSPEYRKRYAEFLKIDFPRIPIPSSKALFKNLCKVGSKLTSLHLMESDILEDEKRLPAFNIEGDCLVDSGYPSYIANGDNPQKGKVYINKDQYFDGVSPDVWEFHIGGYQVCEKWLKDRRQRNLSVDDIRHYEKVTVALKETISLMKEIDVTINENGGWPIK